METELQPLPADELQALQSLRDSIATTWVEDHCLITPKNIKRGLIKLRYNDTQIHTERVIYEIEGKGRPVRLVHLKARQLGETTRGCSRIYYHAYKFKNRRGLISAHDTDSSINIFRKVQMFQQYNPHKLESKYSTRKEITFSAPQNSSILVETGGKEGLGRGQTYDDVHLCLHKDTNVLMGDGETCRISEVFIGDTVIGCSGQPVKVVNKFDTGEKQTLLLSMWLSNEPIALTAEHKVLTIDGWKQAKDIKSGDYICLPEYSFSNKKQFYEFNLPKTEHHYKECDRHKAHIRNSGKNHLEYAKIPLDYDFGYYLGYYLAEGHVHQQHKLPHNDCKVIIAYHQDETYIKKANVFAEKYATSCSHKIEKKFHRGLTVYYGKFLASLTEDICGRVAGKHLPLWILETNPQFGLGVLHGFVDGDGSKTQKDSISITTIHEKIARQIKRLVIALDWGVPAILFYDNRYRYGKKTKDIYLISLSGGLFGKYKNTEHKGRTWINKYKKHNGKWSVRVRSIQEYETANTYDIEVDDPEHGFETLAGIVSNSELAFFDRPEDTMLAVSQCVPSQPGTFITCESCVVGDTLVITDYGLFPIAKLSEGKESQKHYPVLINVFGRNGIHQANSFYVNGMAETRIIKTRYGFHVETTLVHPLLVLSNGNLSWRKAEEIKIGDYLCISYGQQSFGNDLLQFKTTSPCGTTGNKERFCPAVLTKDISYLVGLYISEGYASLKPVRLVITTGDDEIHVYLEKKFGFIRKDKFHSWWFKKDFLDFLKYLGCDISSRAWEKKIPQRILSASKESQVAFLQGMFDGDGSIHSNRTAISYTTTSEQISKTLQVMLLNFGIISRVYKRPPVVGGMARGGKIIGKHDVYTLEIEGNSYEMFLDVIGFRLKRKQDKRIKIKHKEIRIPEGWKIVRESFSGNNRQKREVFKKAGLLRKRGCHESVPSSRYHTNSGLSVNTFRSLLQAGLPAEKEIADYFYDPVVEINPSRNITYDITIPDNQSFISNGIVSHNTPNGMGGYFYDLYRNARKADQDRDLKYMVMPEPGPDRWNGYIRVFHPWFMDAEYRRVVPKDFIKSDEEIDLAQRYGLDDEQVYWRRCIIREQCGGDEDKFKQEFPDNDVDCFLLSGRPVFSAVKVDQMRRQVKPPIEVGKMEKGQFEIDNNGWLEVWEHPMGSDIYAIGADTAEGLDPTEKNDPDFNSAHVINVTTRRVVAKISGRMDPDIFGEQLDALGRLYNDALLGVEVNNSSGGSTRSTLKRLSYPNLFYREILDKTVDEMTERLGWYTDRLSRETLITDLSRAIRQDSFYVPSEQTVHQLGCFVRGKDGKAQAAPGEKDDDVFSLGITWQMAIQVRTAGRNVEVDTAGDEMPKDLDEHNREFHPSMLIGGVEGDDTEIIEAEIEALRGGYEE